MSILTHGSDLSLSLTTTPLVQALDGTLARALTWMATEGFHAAQLDITYAGTRPRDLDQRGRKDLLALFGRRGVRLTGLDLFIPRDHFSVAAHQDRAVSAVLAGIQLAADLGRLPLALALPIHRLDQTVEDTVLSAADAHGVRLAIHAEDQLDALVAWLERIDQPMIGAGLDPAALLARGEDPIASLQGLSHHLTLARLSDALPAEASEDGLSHRVPVGHGRLELGAYRISADLAARRTGPMVLDLRYLPAPGLAAQTAQERWEAATFGF